MDQNRKAMSLLQLAELLAVGIVAGYLSGLVGIGGGIIIVPMLVLLFGFSQYMAQGTTLAMMIPPIGILAVLKYYQGGYVDIRTAGVLCVGFVLGGYFGGLTAVNVSQDVLRKIFGVVLVAVGVKMFLGK